MILLENKRLLIVGIDPGTTSAYAILDLDGLPIHVDSAKSFELSRMIRDVLGFGTIVAVATDKARVPSMVEAFARKVGARIISPSYDLRLDEKRGMARLFSHRNAHEMDALAAARMAHEKLRPLIVRTDAHLREIKRIENREFILEAVIRRSLPLHEAISLLDTLKSSRRQAQVNEDPAPIEIAAEQQTRDERLARKARSLSNELRILRKHAQTLAQENARLERLNKKRALPVPERTHKDAGTERRIRSLSSEVARLRSAQQALTHEHERLRRFLTRMNGCVIVKKLEHFGDAELSKKEALLSIKKGDIVLVRRPNVFSLRALERAGNLLNIVLYEEEPHRHVREITHFTFIPASRVIIEHFDSNIAAADPSKIERERASLVHVQGMVDRIVTQYQQSRKT